MSRKEPVSPTSVRDLANEVKKIKAQIQRITDELNNPELDLGSSVQLNVQRRELEAYLCGILFALGEGDRLDSGTN